MANNYVETEDIINIIKGTPVQIGSYAKKFENGKNRALYPTDHASYIILSYILKDVENKMD